MEAVLHRESRRAGKYLELFHRHEDNPILTACDWPYSAHTVFNAGGCQVGDETVLLVRVEDRRGHSHLTVARSTDGVSNWRIDSKPSLVPQPANRSEEEWGIEDPRVTWVADRGSWVIAYTAYSSTGPMVSLAETKDFRTFDRIGAVMPPENKDAALFPCRIGKRYAMIHRPVASGSSGANMWISFSPDLIHWGGHQVLLRARRGAWWDAKKIGLGPPPLKTAEGWLILYHGVRMTAGGCLYRLGLALLDLDDPCRVIRRSDEWVFAPVTPYERTGDVNGVVFPCAWILDEGSGEIRVYYGGADTCLALATAQLSDLLGYLRTCPTTQTAAPISGKAATISTST
jgi:beta-1,4-mannooligosaccharide/beta-1,4-mannosyl-N-acetylglucosamine phosphorylase